MMTSNLYGHIFHWGLKEGIGSIGACVGALQRGRQGTAMAHGRAEPALPPPPPPGLFILSNKCPKRNTAISEGGLALSKFES